MDKVTMSVQEMAMQMGISLSKAYALTREADFPTDKYRCVNVINLRDRCPVIIMASESCDPPYYRVVDGSLEMFYLSYSEAVDYCRQSGYMTQK